MPMITREELEKYLEWNWLAMREYVRYNQMMAQLNKLYEECTDEL